jgi:hypothetical protein
MFKRCSPSFEFTVKEPLFKPQNISEDITIIGKKILVNVYEWECGSYLHIKLFEIQHSLKAPICENLVNEFIIYDNSFEDQFDRYTLNAIINNEILGKFSEQAIYQIINKNCKDILINFLPAHCRSALNIQK